MNPQNQRSLAKLAEAVRSSKQGLDTLADWLGDGGKPVAFELAHTRASVCARCPLNEKTRWFEFIKMGVSKFISAQERLRTGAHLITIYDPKLGTCKACKCYLKLKVWVPLDKIVDNLLPAQMDELDPKCWVRKEQP